MAKFSSRDAEVLLGKRFESNGSPSKYVSAFQLGDGKQLAVERERPKASLWLESYDQNIHGVDVVKRYSPGDARSSNLNKSRGGQLMEGNPAVYLTVESEVALNKLMEWYMGNEATKKGDAYFTKEHFDLLRTWGEKSYNSEEELQNAAYEKLKQAYDITKKWADVLQQSVFPSGEVVVRRKPTNQANNFTSYNWARIYPESISKVPKEIAFTVGISSENGFTLKIDTVHLGESDSFRQQYLQRRGEFTHSPIVRLIEEDRGLDLGFDGLIEWSKKEIQGLLPLYNELASEFLGKQPMATNIPKNQILYGPPGTGKTYHTVNHALKILDPQFYEENKADRTALKERFDELKEQNLIGFVTFHQSFSYEDFVEGLRAEATDDGTGVHYYVQDGIFKILCDEAKKDSDKGTIDDAITKLMEQVEDEPLRLHTSKGKYFTVSYRGGKTFITKPESSDKGEDYRASIENIKRIYRGGNLKEVYNPSYVLGILNYLKSEFNLSEEPVVETSRQPVVLIIDEINRGNTANIFGELITLIEPSKRAGEVESLSVTLPYSQEKFSVPNNLYIIGTMNTADRSLSHIDTALRRRFVFNEMMPNPSLLNGINVDGVDIQKMLTVINNRIEVLYDREHTLGHSFFMPLSNDSVIDDLATIFELQIIPLLEEYFFEDWEKIRLVLGDEEKQEEHTFITKKYTDNNLIELLGNDYSLHSQSTIYKRNNAALHNPESYIGIYQNGVNGDH